MNHASKAMRNARVIRDMKARDGVLKNEISRRAYLYVARNTTLPPQIRHQAQLQLNTFGKYTRPTTVKNRCSETGRGRGIISEFALCRVILSVHTKKYFAHNIRSTNSGYERWQENSTVCTKPAVNI